MAGGGKNRPRQHSVVPNSPPSQGQAASMSRRVEGLEMRFRSGPLPAPEELAQYNSIIPNGADRILRMAEEQQQHRMYLEKYVVRSDSKRAWAGLCAGAVVALSILGASVWLIMTGHETAGTVIAGLDMASVAGTFVYGHHARQQERADKAKVMTGSRQG